MKSITEIISAKDLVLTASIERWLLALLLWQYDAALVMHDSQKTGCGKLPL